jgi:hypothetical protein
MNSARQPSNIYYLPVLAPATPVAPRSRWDRVEGRLRRMWWRVRFTASGIRAAFRGPSPAVDEADLATFLAGCTEAVSPRRPPVTRAALIIDFGAARRRLRPAPGV